MRKNIPAIIFIMITIIGLTSYYANDHLKITNMNGDITYLTKLAELG